MLLQIAVLAVFFFSGAAALTYEVVWMRQLSLIFGATTLAVTTVLATFMGGLALGSWWLGRRADRTSRLLVVYAVLEVGIGLYALLVPALFDALRHPYILLRQVDLPYSTMAAGRGLLAGLVLLLPTALMGGTFPVLARLFVQLRGDVGHAAGLLYFFNTAGAMTGCYLAGFHWIERLGLMNTTRMAVAVNLVLAATVVVIARRQGPGESAPTIHSPDEDGTSPVTALGARLALACIGLSGFVSLAYEVLWTRALLRYLYNSTYAFTTMLVTFLAGIALGGWLYTVCPGRKRHPLLLFAAFQTLVGLGFAVSSILFGDLMGISSLLTGGEIAHSFRESVWAMFVRASLILLAPAVFLGASLPLATAICARRPGTVGTTVGRVYAVNTLGSILGTVAATFVLIPSLGMQGSLLLLIGTNLAMAAALAIAGAPSPQRRVAAGLAMAGVFAAGVALVPEDLFRRTYTQPWQKLIFYREGATDTVGVVETNGVRLIVYEDMRGTASTATYSWNYLFGHLPVLLHPGEPRRGLHICFGVGNSLSAMAAHESLERIDSVELSPHSLEAAPYFWTNDGVLANPKVRTIIDDGRNFVMTSRETYDVIELEPPETFTAGVINLYTREFYRDVAERLAPDGVFVQWVPVGEAPLDEERMLFRAFHEVFPHATAWQQMFQDGPILLVGARRPLQIDYELLKEKMQRERVRQDLELIGVTSADFLLAMFVFDEDAFGEFVRGVPPVTDDRTVLDFSMPRYIGSGFGLGIFSRRARADGQVPIDFNFERRRDYHRQRRSVVPYLTNLGGEDPAAIEARIRRQTLPRWKNRPPHIAEADWQRW
jgi:spermidine synthase